MQIVYLDQNKWIELAQAAKHPTKHVRTTSLLRRIRKQLSAGKLVLPLTFANIYETHKVNNPQRRRDLAFVQAFFSRGIVIRGRHSRAQIEVAHVLADCRQLKLPEREDYWFLSNVFFEAVSDWEDVQRELGISEQVIAFIRSNPAGTLFEYLVETPDDIRTAAVRRFSAGSDRLHALVEDRRRKHASEPSSVRRRIYNALLMIDDIERIVASANRIGISWRGTADIEASTARRLMNDVPTYHIETELAVRLEAQDRPVHENDFRDIQSFCAAIPYCNVLVGEKQFVNLARQGGLDKRYSTKLLTKLDALLDIL